jgi:hypothetical protein
MALSAEVGRLIRKFGIGTWSDKSKGGLVAKRTVAILSLEIAR